MTINDLNLWTVANDWTWSTLRAWGQIIKDAINAKTETTDFNAHTSNTSNPHNVTTTQLGLENVDNTSDANKPISAATQTALDSKQDSSEKWAADWYAELDWTGKVPLSQIPATIGTWDMLSSTYDPQSIGNDAFARVNHTGQEQTGDIADNAITFDKMQDITTNKLIGRHSSGNWNPEEVGIWNNLEISGNNLQAKTWTTAGTVAIGDHLHTWVYEPVFSKNTAFNKDFGTISWTVLEGSNDALYAKLASTNTFTGTKQDINGRINVGGANDNASFRTHIKASGDNTFPLVLSAQDNDFLFAVKNSPTLWAEMQVFDENSNVTSQIRGGGDSYINGWSLTVGSASASASAKLKVVSTTKWFLPPVMTTTQRDAIWSPAEWLMIYNSTTKVMNFYNWTTWWAI